MKSCRYFILSILILFVINGCSKSTDSDEDSDNVATGYKLTGYNIETELPCFVNIMFQVTDLDGNGVTDLETEDFNIYEDDDLVSPTESFPQIRKRGEIPYALKTVLMLDNSASVATKLDSIKLAAVNLVHNIADQQEYAIYKFSEEPELIQDFTNDVEILTAVINSIQVGYATTDLYGSVIEGVSKLDDFHHLDSIQQSFMIMLTDGSDTQGSHTIEEALAIRGNKRVFTIGLGDEIEPDKLALIGNAGFYSVSSVSDLVGKFEEIQNKMLTWANSFYLLNYMSPTRGELPHTIKLEVKNNGYIGPESTIEGYFSSHGFYSVAFGVYVNVSEDHPFGIDSLTTTLELPVILEARTFLASYPTQYIWGTSSDSIVITVDAGDNSVAEVLSIGRLEVDAKITVTDTSNNVSTEISVRNKLIEYIGNLPTSTIAQSISISGDYAYLANYTDGLKILDLSVPSVPFVKGSYPTGSSTVEAFVMGDNAYLASGSAGLIIINVSEPQNPTFRGQFNTDGLTYGVFVDGNLAYIADHSRGLKIIDVGDPSDPVLVGTYNTPGTAYDVIIREDTAYVSCGLDGFVILNVADSSAPTLVGSYDTPYSTKSCWVEGDVLYAADILTGLMIFDISNPETPIHLGTFDTPDQVMDVHVQGSYACIADGNLGIRILDISDPANIVELDSYNTPGFAVDVAFYGQWAYVSDYYSGVQVFRIMYPIE